MRFGRAVDGRCRRRRCAARVVVARDSRTTGRGEGLALAAVEIVEGEVRELIRRRGVDPVREHPVVRGLIEEVIADYADRALSGALPVLADPAGAARALFDSVAGLGPL